MPLNTIQKTISFFQQNLGARRILVRKNSHAVLLLKVESCDYNVRQSDLELRTAATLKVLGYQVVANEPITKVGFRMRHLPNTILRILSNSNLKTRTLLVVDNVGELKEVLAPYLFKQIQSKFILRSVDDVFFDAGREEYEMQIQ